jgi:hypothetical protein
VTREGVLLLTLAFVVVLIGVGALAWMRRRRRDGGVQVPLGEAPDGASTLAQHRTLYVATTAYGEPLERLALQGWGFRSRADLVVTDAGLAVDLTGQPRAFFDTDRITEVDQATVAIDRVVEPGGLVRIAWRLDDGTLVDSYFRPQDASARAVADSIRPLLSPSSTGSDA